MPFVLQISFGEDEQYYYIRVKENSYDEIYDPRHATIFQSGKAAREWRDTFLSMAEYVRPVNLNKAAEMFQAWLNSGGYRRSVPLVDQHLSRPYSNESPEEVLDWWWNVRREFDRKVHQKHYSSWPPLYMKFQHLYNINMYIDITRPEKGYDLRFQIAVKQNQMSFEVFETEIALAMIKASEYPNENGEIVFDIFDHFLSEGGNSVVLVHLPDHSWCVRHTRWIDSVKVRDGDLETCFEYIRTNRYYE